MAFLGPRRDRRRRNCDFRYEPFLLDAAQADSTKVSLSQSALFLVFRDRRFPALSSFRGHSPAHEIKCPTFGNRPISVPISAIKTCAAVWPMPGIVLSLSMSLA